MSCGRGLVELKMVSMQLWEGVNELWEGVRGVKDGLNELWEGVRGVKDGFNAVVGGDQ